MRKQWLWIALFCIVSVGVVLGNKWQPKAPAPVQAVRFENQAPNNWEQHWQRAIADIAQTNAAGAAPRPVDAPKVDRNQLLKHLDALAFERYEDGDRAQVRDYLAQELEALGWSPVLQPFEGGVNVVAERSGTNPKAGKIVVGAHYDTVIGSPGADDNASGVAVVLEMARLFSQRLTARGLQVAFFDQEEKGLRGSLAFTGEDKNLKDVRGAIVLDMVGFACYTPGCQQYPSTLPVKPPSDRGDFLAVVGDQEHLPLLDAFQQPQQAELPPLLPLPIPLKGMLTPDVLRSDHAPFWYRGIGAVLATDTANLRTPHYHQDSDTPDTVDPKFLTGSAQRIVNAATVLLDSQGSLATMPVTPSQSPDQSPALQS